jgi:hypothetical protein
MSPKPALRIVVNNHFDLTWRRCAWRRFTDQGRTFASYADIWIWYVEDNLALCAAEPGYRFDIESPAVARTVIARRPDLLPRLRELADTGRLGLACTGDNIVDGNLLHGETLVRNFTNGLAWTERVLGLRPRLAARNDAFGNPAQLPQILRGVGQDWVLGLSYSGVGKYRYWRGLDGSVVCTAQPPWAAQSGGYHKLRPCAICQGVGCPACGGRGVDAAYARSHLPEQLDQTVIAARGQGAVRLGSEEALPHAGILAWAAAQRDGFAVSFAREEDLRDSVQADLDRIGDPPADEVFPGVELNPNNSGCLVTRIGLKQRSRAAEALVRLIETRAALGPVWPAQAMETLWERLLFAYFHDAVTATTVDPAADELSAVLDGLLADGRALLTDLTVTAPAPGEAWTALNPLGATASALVAIAAPGDAAFADDAGPVPSIPDAGGVRVLARAVSGLGVRTIRRVAGRQRIRDLAEPVLDNGRFRIAADQRGLVAIDDLRLGRRIAERRGDHDPCGLSLETDVGSPWATLEQPGPPRGLGPYSRIAAAEAGDGWQRLRIVWDRGVGRIGGLGFSGSGFRAEQEILLVDGLDRIEVATSVDWDCHGMRLRLCLPVPATGRGWYAVPYGMLERPAYQPTLAWAGANGDWPAVGWAGVEADACAVALLDRGTPSYRVDGDGMIWNSLLRSPTLPTYLHEPAYYSMTDWDGMRDAGSHRFRHAIAATAGAFAGSTIPAEAEAFNADLGPVAGVVAALPAPVVSGDGVGLGALTRSDDGLLLLRLVEGRGRSAEAVVRLPPGLDRAWRSDLRGAGRASLPVVDGAVRCPLRAWEIATIVLG